MESVGTIGEGGDSCVKGEGRKCGCVVSGGGQSDEWGRLKLM